MGLSVRHFQRVVVEFHQRFGFNAEGLDRRAQPPALLLLGAGFMTAPGAGAEAVGRAMGFASASAFSKALVNAGLPAPGAVAAAVAALRGRPRGVVSARGRRSRWRRVEQAPEVGRGTRAPRAAPCRPRS